MADVRECRLVPKYAHLYEGLPADVWLPAREIAERLVVRASKARALRIRQRTFDARHFEFRGGAAEFRSPRLRTRAGDLFEPGETS